MLKNLETVHIPAQFIICDDVENTEFIQELADSIREKGLLNPVTVQALNGIDDQGNPRFKVVAGRKRLKACVLVGATSIPCRVTSGDDTEVKLITIEENLRRTNLPWWDISRLVAEWHDTRQSQLGKAEPKKGKATRENPGWSMRDTADELKMSLGFISEAVMLSKAVEKDPSLRNIADRDTAIRLVRSAAKRIEAEVMATAPVEFAVNQVYNGPAAEVIKRFDPQTFNACISDPPWLKYIDEKLTRDDETLPVFKELYRVMKTDSFIYLFVGFEDFYSYSKFLPQYGFSVSKTPLLWVKKELRVVPFQAGLDGPVGGPEKAQDFRAQLHGVTLSKGARSWEYSRDFELILLAVKGSPALVESVQQSSIKVFPPLPPVKLTHPNEKPIDLIKDILDDCTHEGSIVIDPFAGSGAHLDACKQLRRRYIGIERDRTFYEQIVERLK